MVVVGGGVREKRRATDPNGRVSTRPDNSSVGEYNTTEGKYNLDGGLQENDYGVKGGMIRQRAQPLLCTKTVLGGGHLLRMWDPVLL